MNPYRFHYAEGCFFPFRLDLELRVINLLKKHGFKVIYKMHPERQHEVEGIFDGLVDRIITKPFEKVYKEADALFFGYGNSTTFGFALGTNRPLFLIDIENTNWNPEVHELLSRRCIIVPAKFDEKNRIQFDEGYFLEKLGQKPEMPDFAYVEKFMIPTNFKKRVTKDE